jgi:SAM-dependent methyltransferase
VAEHLVILSPMTTPGTASLLERLADAVGRDGRVRGLSPERYAITHAAYEDVSDQRGKVLAWLIDEVPALAARVTDRPLAVLGVGVGDGSVDGPLAARLATDERTVHYHGVEPHGASLEGFTARLRGLGRPRLHVTTSMSDFGGFTDRGPYDIVHFVHSLYYVPDVGAAIDRAMGLLRPGGSLIALTSPREPLSVLTSLLAPQTTHPQWFAETIGAAFTERDLSVSTTTIEGRLDLTSLHADPSGLGEQILDFLIQARSIDLSPEVRALVDAHLDEIALEEGSFTVPHPLVAMVVSPP